MTIEVLMLLAVVVPLTGAGLIALFHNHPNWRETVTLTTATGLFVCVVSMIPEILGGGRPRITLLPILPGTALEFAVEPLGMLFAAVAALLWIVNSVYSIGYMRGNRERNQTRFYVYFAIALAATMGIAFSANLLTLFIFYEILTLTTYPLVTHKSTNEAVRSGRVYLGLLLSTSIGFFLLAILWTWDIAGTLDFTPGGILAGHTDSLVTGILLLLFMFGIGKSALMPFHRWLTAAMVAPTPVSALLHAVAVVKAGVFTAVKVIVYIFGLDLLNSDGAGDWLLYIAGTTVLMASVFALRQDNLKLRLAYSTISQLSYVILAAAILAPLSVVGAALHIAAHAFGKITLFFAAGSIYTASHKTLVSELDGIGQRMPWTMGAFTIGALSMIGVPLTAGFISKWYMLLAAMETGNVFALGVLVLSTLLNAAYFLPIVYVAFFRSPPRGAGESVHGEAPFPVVLATVGTAMLTLLMFWYPGLPLQLADGLIGGR